MSYRKFWTICKPALPGLGAGVLLLVVLSLVDIRSDGIHAGAIVLPIRTGGSTVNWVWASALSMCLPVLYYLTILVFLWERRKTWLRVAAFQGQLILIVLLPVWISFGSGSDMLRFLFLTVCATIILNGFLLLFSWLSGSRLVSGIIMVLIQLAGPALAYLYAFHDLLPGWWGRLAVFLYRELPLYQKMGAMWEELDWAAILPDLILAILVMGYAWVVHCLEDRKGPEQSV